MFHNKPLNQSEIAGNVATISPKAVRNYPMQ